MNHELLRLSAEGFYLVLCGFCSIDFWHSLIIDKHLIVLVNDGFKVLCRKVVFSRVQVFEDFLEDVGILFGECSATSMFFLYVR